MGRGGGQRPFGSFPKKHPFWRIQSPLRSLWVIYSWSYSALGSLPQKKFNDCSRNYLIIYRNSPFSISCQTGWAKHQTRAALRCCMSWNTLLTLILPPSPWWSVASWCLPCPNITAHCISKWSRCSKLQEFFLKNLSWLILSVSRSAHPGCRDSVIQYRVRLIQVFEIMGHQFHNFICEILPCSFKVRVFWIVSVLWKCCSWRVGRCSKFWETTVHCTAHHKSTSCSSLLFRILIFVMIL